ncbi:hypothetical protein PIB30_117381 [Stylosanthes scabra]|uniref:Uncharacterized protein n=1 Tax=Stylosanthes scabra TaxID=79078 RepID=A0ABU6SE32_9FABA|nr:hypothetical protein [Stylosanthes scabra]
MRVEQEQKVTEDARRFAEQDAEAQRYAVQVLQSKYEEATAALAEMEKRAVMAESMLEATLQYQSGQAKAQPSPRSLQPESPASRNNPEPTIDIPPRRVSLLSRWRNKGKEEPADGKPIVEEQSMGKPKVEEQSMEKPKVEEHSKEQPKVEEESMGKPTVEEQSAVNQQEGNGLKVEDEIRKEDNA